jgi:hypothetical protein
MFKYFLPLLVILLAIINNQHPINAMKSSAGQPKALLPTVKSPKGSTGSDLPSPSNLAIKQQPSMRTAGGLRMAGGKAHALHGQSSDSIHGFGETKENTNMNFQHLEVVNCLFVGDC